MPNLSFASTQFHIIGDQQLSNIDIPYLVKTDVTNADEAVYSNNSLSQRAKICP